MRALVRPAALLLALAMLTGGCGTSSGGGRSTSVRCLDRGATGGQSSLTTSEEPDRPLFFFFCVQSP